MESTFNPFTRKLDFLGSGGGQAEAYRHASGFSQLAPTSDLFIPFAEFSIKSDSPSGHFVEKGIEVIADFQTITFNAEPYFYGQSSRNCHFLLHIYLRYELTGGTHVETFVTDAITGNVLTDFVVTATTDTSESKRVYTLYWKSINRYDKLFYSVNYIASCYDVLSTNFNWAEAQGIRSSFYEEDNPQFLRQLQPQTNTPTDKPAEADTIIRLKGGDKVNVSYNDTSIENLTLIADDDLTADTEIDFEANTITPDTEINLPSITAYKNEDLQAVSDYDKLVTIFSGEDLYVAFLTDSL